jgi:hypothetical protein
MRRTGKTTRLIDAAIQSLFEKKELRLSLNHDVKSDFLDQDSTPGNQAQRNFVERLVKRLSTEHSYCCEIKKQGNLVFITLK